MLSQVKGVSIKVLIPIIAAIIFSSCGVTLDQSYYDENYKTTIVPTTDKLLSTDQEGERAVGWLIARNDSIFMVLELQYSRTNHQRFYMPKGNYLSVEFSDGATYQLINSSDIRSRRGVVLGDNDLVADALIPLSDNDMNVLSSKTIVALNVQTSARNSRFLIKSSKDLAIKKMISIIRPQTQPYVPQLKLPSIR